MSLQHLPDLSSVQCFLVALLVTLLSTSSDACGKPPTFENMQPIGNLKASYNTGDQVQYSCKPGYMRQHSVSISSVCAANGQWSPVSKDGCYKKSCPREDDPVNGQVNILNGSIEFGTQIQYVCNPGFYLIGKSIIKCILKGSDVVWSDPSPTCSKILCAPPPTIKNGTFSPSENDVFEYHEVATYRCNRVSGKDELSLVGESQIYCIGNRLWSADPPECKVVKCPYPVIENGRQTAGFSRKYSYRDTITFECNEGLFLHGNSTVVCEGNSTWQPPIPTCRSEPPPPPTTPSSVTVSKSTGFSKAVSLEFGGSNGWIISLIMIAVLELQ